MDQAAVRQQKPAQEPTMPASSRWTWADFIALDEDDQRELVDGALVELEMPTYLHESIVAYLVTMLTFWTMTHSGKVCGSGYKVRISQRRGVMPDVQYYRKGRQLPPQGLTEGAPDLVVEVISPTSQSHDRVTKLRWYAAIGTREYWIVDPEERSVQQLVLQPGPDGDNHWLIADAVVVQADPEVEAPAPLLWRPTTFDGLELDLTRMFTVPE